jgi:putative transposase
MVKPSIALAELLEKGSDTDLLREMIQHIVQRVMEMDVENICAASYANATPSARTAATVIGSGSGRRAPAR